MQIQDIFFIRTVEFKIKSESFVTIRSLKYICIFYNYIGEISILIYIICISKLKSSIW